MNIADHVCSFGLAKRLKELGVKQESLFYYQNQPYYEGMDCEEDEINILIKEMI